LFLHVGCKAPNVADRLKADVVCLHLTHLAADVAFEHRHQAGHLGLRTLPVLGRERIERYGRDHQTGASVEDRTYRFRPGPVTEDAWCATLLCPTAVAVQEDGAVPRQTTELAGGKRVRFGRSGF